MRRRADRGCNGQRQPTDNHRSISYEPIKADELFQFVKTVAGWTEKPAASLRRTYRRGSTRNRFSSDFHPQRSLGCSSRVSCVVFLNRILRPNRRHGQLLTCAAQKTRKGRSVVPNLPVRMERRPGSCADTWRTAFLTVSLAGRDTQPLEIQEAVRSRRDSRSIGVRGADRTLHGTFAKPPPRGRLPVWGSLESRHADEAGARVFAER
jgi:hypothetical protein